mmetsp:Transcript_11042/g.33108  ORF Transcript_11042/g.33108 Transcript_11042/m.33108 type:complete len:285 (+) Transcript_11042:791-1645(+)
MVDGLPRSSPRSNGGAFRDGQCERLLLKAMLCMPKGGGCKGKRPRVAQRRNGNVACEGPYAAGGQARSAEGAGRTVAALQLQTTVGYPQYVNLPEGCSHAGAHAPLINFVHGVINVFVLFPTGRASGGILRLLHNVGNVLLCLQTRCGGRQVVIHLLHAWRQVLQIPWVPLDVIHRVPVAGLRDENKFEEVLAFSRHPDVGRELVLHPQDPLNHLLQLLVVVLVLGSLEGVSTHQHDVQHHSTRPDICDLAVICLTLGGHDDLRRQVRRRTHPTPRCTLKLFVL